jgi:hypothetical protein
VKGVFSDTDEAYMLFLGQQLFLHSLYLVFTCKIISLNLSISTFQAGKFQSVFELSEWLLLNTKWAILSAISWWEQVSFDEMMILSAVY